MAKFQNRGQGTFNAIMWLVLIVLIVDIFVAAVMLFDLDLGFSNKDSGRTDNVVTTPKPTVSTTDNVR